MGFPRNMMRSMNASLQEGTTDGKYRKYINDRSNVHFPEAQAVVAERRSDLSWPEGVNESPRMFTPEGKPVVNDDLYYW